jgi:hypothetical protein
MHVRVAKWEGVSQETMRNAAERVGGADGPPDGVPAQRLIMLADEGSGRLIMMPFFETEDDLATGNATLKDMTPPEGLGTPQVESYEVKLDLQAP